ncbi:MAG: DUF2239 family protein [Phenylobacterium sp.]|uniref:DUF2239 family protein n=1 Tax=Phenylobacterium sp. TaxID=1871053 RepID=UPI0025CD6945|nr:DUF2239 family protein [Phenylobacterium sp.]MBI1198507.1 DUF2239 family protein [Phenylobacterium sp.]
MDRPSTFTAFHGARRVAHGALAEVARGLAAAAAEPGVGAGPVVLLEDATGDVVDLDLRLDPDAAAAAWRAARTPPPSAPAGARPARGRPRLGVVAREVTLLPRHWTWLAAQPGGASAALRRLVEQASREQAPADLARQARDARYRAMAVLAGDRPGFEEAARALFAGDAARFAECVAAWPADVAAYLLRD